MAFPFHFSLSFCSFFFRFLLSSVEPPYLFLAVVFLSFSSLFSFCYLGPSFFFCSRRNGRLTVAANSWHFFICFCFSLITFSFSFCAIRRSFGTFSFFFSFEFSSSLPAGFYFLMLFIFVSYPALFSFFFRRFFSFFYPHKSAPLLGGSHSFIFF